jgi:hypothetical protein
VKFDARAAMPRPTAHHCAIAAHRRFESVFEETISKRMSAIGGKADIR